MSVSLIRIESTMPVSGYEILGKVRYEKTIIIITNLRALFLNDPKALLHKN